MDLPSLVASHAYANITTLVLSIKLDHKFLLLTNEFNFLAKELKQWIALPGITDLMMFPFIQKQLALLNSEVAN